MSTMQKPIGRLHVLTDYYFQQRYSHAALARLAIEGGADTIQFRQKIGGVRHQLHEAKETASACAEKGVPLVIDDRIDLMLGTRAAGVHLGQQDFPIEDARHVLGPDLILGATVTTTEQAVRACEAGADYLGFGPVFPTRSKANPASVKGLEGLREVCRLVSVPVIAIAGITVKRVRPVLDAGAHGIAVMSAITMASDPTSAAEAFRQEIDAFVNG